MTTKSARAYVFYLAWGISLLAMAGSLFFSEIMQLPPCVLCWYQRIAMYPLVFLIPVGILLKDSKLRAYVLTLSTLGLGISSYHVLLYYGVLPESIKPCTMGVSCTSRQIEWLGFITIPLLSQIAFFAITISALLYSPQKDNT